MFKKITQCCKLTSPVPQAETLYRAVNLLCFDSFQIAHRGSVECEMHFFFLQFFNFSDCEECGGKQRDKTHGCLP